MVIFVQLGIELKEEMAETLRRYYGVELDKYYNREVTYSWDRIQNRVITININIKLLFAVMPLGSTCIKKSKFYTGQLCI